MTKRELAAAIKEKRRQVERAERGLVELREDLAELEAETPDDPADKPEEDIL